MSNKQWIFEYPGINECQVVLKPTGSNVVIGPNNKPMLVQTSNPVFLKFFASKAIVDDVKAKPFGLTGEEMANLALAHTNCGKTFYCVSSPERALTPEEKAKIENEIQQARSVSKEKVSRGTRATGSR